MKSDPPPNSTATFDAMWESLDEEAFADLPPALAPKPVPLPERDTVLPPVPPPEYVQTMMELGEIDDPSEAIALAVIPIPPPPAPPGKSLGLVMATESELLLGEPDHEEEDLFLLEEPPPPKPTPQPEVSKPPAFDGGFAARVAARRPPPPPVPPNTSSAGLRAVLGPRRGTQPTNPNLPIPRAPSIPPPLDTGGLDAFDALDSLSELPFSPVITPPPPAPAPAPPAPSRRTGTPMDMRALRQDGDAPSSSRSPKSGGFRLSKTPPTNTSSEHDRVTPVSDEGMLGWSASALAIGAPLRSASQPKMSAVSAVAAFDLEAIPESLPPTSAVERASEMQSLFEARNYSAALVIAESILTSAPGHAQARRCADSCREMLAQKYLDRLGGRNGIPHVTVSPDEMRGLSLDHRAGFLVSSIDGGSTIDELLDVCSMPELDALRILFELKEQGAIEVREPMRRKR